MTPAYRFGLFELQPKQRRLLTDGRPVELGHRAFDVLLVLVERAGQLVTKDELLGLVWPDLVVEENNLQVQVSSLRKILGAAAIATAPGRGYRFALELTPVGESSSPPLAQRHNLPHQLTSLIGHEEDLEEYAALLDQARLLPLTGIGGSGKTRLAIKLAERVLPSFVDGVLVISREIRDDGRAAEALRFVGYANLALGDRATARSDGGLRTWIARPRLRPSWVNGNAKRESMEQPRR